MFGLAGQVGHLRDGELHAGGQFVAGNSRGQFGVAGKPLGVAFIEALEKTPRGAVAGGGHATGACQIANWICGVELGALESRRQESGRPVVHAVLGLTTRIGKGHISGQALVVAAQGVGHPSAHAGKSIQRVAGGHVILAGAVRVGLPLHGVDEAHLIGQIAEVWQQVRDHLAALTAGTELPRALVQCTLLALEGDELLGAGHGLTMATDQLRLVIEGVELAAGAATKDHQHILGARREVRLARTIRPTGLDGRAEGLWPTGRFSQKTLPTQKMGQGNGSQAQTGVAEEATPIQQWALESGKVWRAHGMNRNSLALRMPRQKACNPSERTKTTASATSAVCGTRLKASCHAART